MSIKISSLELENVKRVRAVSLEPTQNGLTVIGGKNGQGKTSVLDAIAWALGGEKFRPSMPKREGSVLPPDIKITLSNGIVVERKGQNSTLRVTDPSGSRRGQQLLDSFVEKLALNLPKFMNASDREKAETLLNIIGVGPQLIDLDQREQRLYNERTMVGRIADQKAKHAAELPTYENVPDDLVSASELILQQQTILAKNGENARKRARVNEITFEKHRIADELSRLESQKADLEQRIVERKQAFESVARDEEIARMDAIRLHDESTEEIERNIVRIDEINTMVRANLDHEKAIEDAKAYANQYNDLTGQIETVRAERRSLLESAQLPLPELGVENGALVYKGQAWDCMSSSEQLKVATAIVRRLNPECGFVLMDRLEAMDGDTLREFGEWLEAEGLQVIATRVSTDAEACTIIIEDGLAVTAPAAAEKPKYNEGVF